MQEEIFRALEAGATVMTASRRLARFLARDYHSMQIARGLSVWSRPDILPFDAFLERSWNEWLARYGDENTPRLLDNFQEQALWAQVIRAAPEGESLLQIAQAARQAGETWQLVIEYRLPVDGSYEAAEDWSAFAAWSKEFRALCRGYGWMERARLADFLRERIGAQELRPPSVVFAAGFEEMTPLQTEFFGALGEWKPIETPSESPAVERRKLRDSTGEIRTAAAWARKLLEENPGTQIGIVIVPDLTRSRATVERILREVLEPGIDRADRRSACHLSVGPCLEEYPLVHAALQLLEFACGKLPLPRVGMLLRSPFLGGAGTECGRRAQLDAKLRRKGIWDVSLSGLIEEAGNCPQLQRLLRRAERQLRTMPREQPPSYWHSDIGDLLEAFGWPGERTLASDEFQVIARWRELLSSFAAIDLAVPAMSLAQAVDWLRRQCTEIRFQAEDEGAPVQVMGMLEASGLRFDHLWIMGLHDDALPAPANPNPFLPISLQRQRRLPHSSAERELEFAHKLVDQLLASAPDVILSYPAADGDRALLPSPLISGDWLDAGEVDGDPWITSMRESATFEESTDDVAPAFAQSDSAGGASLFKDIAACPFRSFAKHRLGARPLEETDIGLSYRDRGTTVHGALEFIWRELGSQARLLESSEAELRALIGCGADAAVEKLGPGMGRDLEKRRLQKLLWEWLNIEKAREPFSVAQLEDERAVEIGGLRVKTKADRVDALPDGSEIILDYKTGQVESGDWEGDRPDEPQLPLYSVTNELPVSGAAFAAIRTGELRFRGLGVTLPDMAAMKMHPPLPFDAQLKEWRRVLERLAESYRAGEAQADPKPGACDHCGLRGLCRVREMEHDRR
jgi:ATP-dependent helicase/nuclease subunit B